MNILVVGGYGDVGGRISRRLVEAGARVAVAGRSLGKALDFAHRAGSLEAIELDLNDKGTLPSALAGRRFVINCVEDVQGCLAEAAAERGLHYLDISAEARGLLRARRQSSTARATGARIWLGCGVQPGISNLLAGMVNRAVGGAERIDILLHASLFDGFGAGSLEYMLRNISDPRDPAAIGCSGKRAFERRIRWGLPDGRPVTAHNFPFGDRIFYRKTIRVADVSTWLALGPASSGKIVAAIGRSRLARSLSAERSRHVARLLSRLSGIGGRRPFWVAAQARKDNSTDCLAFRGEGIAAFTALVAVEAFHQLMSHGEAGVWLPEEVINGERLFASLEEHGGLLCRGGRILWPEKL